MNQHTIEVHFCGNTLQESHELMRFKHNVASEFDFTIPVNILKQTLLNARIAFNTDLSLIVNHDLVHIQYRSLIWWCSVKDIYHICTHADKRGASVVIVKYICDDYAVAKVQNLSMYFTNHRESTVKPIDSINYLPINNEFDSHKH